MFVTKAKNHRLVSRRRHRLSAMGSITVTPLRVPANVGASKRLTIITLDRETLKHVLPRAPAFFRAAGRVRSTGDRHVEAPANDEWRPRGTGGDRVRGRSDP